MRAISLHRYCTMLGGIFAYYAAPTLQSVASLGLVTPGAATESVTLIFSWKKWRPFLVINVCPSVSSAVSPYLFFPENLTIFFCSSLSFLFISLGCHPLEGVTHGGPAETSLITVRLEIAVPWSYSVAAYGIAHGSSQGAVSRSRTTERWPFHSTRQVNAPADIITGESKSITCSFSTSACGWAARRRVWPNFRFVGGADAQSNYVSAHSCRPG